MYETKALNDLYVTRFRDFRQQYRDCFLKRRAALAGLVDAVKESSNINSFVELSLASAFKHRWHSAYAALSDSVIDTKRLNRLCLEQVPEREVLYFAVDVMNVRRPSSKTLKERMVCHGAKREAFGKGLIIGLPYSMLAFCDGIGTSWTPTVNTQRIKPLSSAVDVAVEQIAWLTRNLADPERASIGLDGGYGNIGFFQQMKGKKTFAVARLRNDRLMYQRPPEPDGKRGRDRKYGAGFKFNEDETLTQAEEVIEFEDQQHGAVRIEKWSNLRFRVADEVVEIEVIRSQIHLEKKKPPAARWYGIHNETGEPTSLARSYQTAKHRWGIEPANRFKKERLYAEKPQVREAISSDNWLQISQLLEWELYLYKPLAKDEKMPWQAELKEENLTPGRVIRSLAKNINEVGTADYQVLPRGKSKGWKKGRKRSRPMKYEVELKGRKKPIQATQRE